MQLILNVPHGKIRFKSVLVRSVTVCANIISDLSIITFYWGEEELLWHIAHQSCNAPVSKTLRYWNVYLQLAEPAFQGYVKCGVGKFNYKFSIIFFKHCQMQTSLWSYIHLSFTCFLYTCTVQVTLEGFWLLKKKHVGNI